MARHVRVEYPGAIYHEIIRSRKLIEEDSELRSQVKRCEKRLNELRVTEQLLKA